jgi:hypothetical protein
MLWLGNTGWNMYIQSLDKYISVAVFVFVDVQFEIGVAECVDIEN